MARPRLPAAKAETSGAAIKNAGRFKDRQTPKRKRPIGEPYASMTDPQKVVWHECVTEMPWLTSAHRLLLRQVCMLSARMDDPDMGVSALQALGSLLSKLGATPVDETKVNHGEDDDAEDPADKYFNRGRPN
jgi:hypothetical protein